MIGSSGIAPIRSLVKERFVLLLVYGDYLASLMLLALQMQNFSFSLLLPVPYSIIFFGGLVSTWLCSEFIPGTMLRDLSWLGDYSARG